jgi:glycosyltransferase involved in cell wall biosynthesis
MNFRACVTVPVFDHGVGATTLARKLEPMGLKTFMVDDGSDAVTQAALAELAERHDWIEIHRHPKNLGKGAAVLTGLRAALASGYTHAVQIDADGQHDPDDIARFLALAGENPHALILGRPEFDGTAPKGRLIARYLTHVWIWIETLSFTIKDSMCGFRVYPLAPVVRLAERVRLGRRMDFDPEILVRLYWEGLPVLSLPTRVTYPEGGKSHFRLWHDNCLLSWMHTRLVILMMWRFVRFRGRRSIAAPHT